MKDLMSYLFLPSELLKLSSSLIYKVVRTKTGQTIVSTEVRIPKNTVFNPLRRFAKTSIP